MYDRGLEEKRNVWFIYKYFTANYAWYNESDTNFHKTVLNSQRENFKVIQPFK